MNLQNRWNPRKVWLDVEPSDLLQRQLENEGDNLGRLEALDAQVKYLAGVVVRLLPLVVKDDAKVLDVLECCDWILVEK